LAFAEADHGGGALEAGEDVVRDLLAVVRHAETVPN